MGIETILIGAALAGSAVSAMGSIQKGKAEKESADYNAAVRDQQAAADRNVADTESSDYFRKEMRQRAAGIAARGASGVTMEGSPLLVDEATVGEIALGTSRIMHGGERRAKREEQEAALYRKRGENAKTASYYDAGTSLLSGFGKAAKGWG